MFPLVENPLLTHDVTDNNKSGSVKSKLVINILQGLVLSTA